MVDQYGIGRPTLWTEEHVALLQTLLESAPDRWGCFANDWTVPFLQEQLLHFSGQAFAEDTVRRQLHRLGYVCATAWPPTRSWRKKRRIRRQARSLRPRSVLLAEDETDLLLFPPLRAGWSLRGQDRDIPMSGQNARRVVFGAMNLWTGYRRFLAREYQRAGDFQVVPAAASSPLPRLECGSPVG